MCCRYCRSRLLWARWSCKCAGGSCTQSKGWESLVKPRVRQQSRAAQCWSSMSMELALLPSSTESCCKGKWQLNYAVCLACSRFTFWRKVLVSSDTSSNRFPASADQSAHYTLSSSAVQQRLPQRLKVSKSFPSKAVIPIRKVETAQAQPLCCPCHPVLRAWGHLSSASPFPESHGAPQTLALTFPLFHLFL